MLSKAALWEAVKEGLRVVVVALVSLLIVQLEAGVVEFKVLAVTGLIALLRAVEKYMHKVKAKAVIPF